MIGKQKEEKKKGGEEDEPLSPLSLSIGADDTD
jgi:hypothetical protein